MQTKLDLVAEPRVLKLDVRASVSLSRMETGLRRQSLVDCVARVCASEKETKEERGRAVQRTWAGRGQTKDLGARCGAGTSDRSPRRLLADQRLAEANSFPHVPLHRSACLLCIRECIPAFDVMLMQPGIAPSCLDTIFAL